MSIQCEIFRVAEEQSFRTSLRRMIPLLLCGTLSFMLLSTSACRAFTPGATTPEPTPEPETALERLEPEAAPEAEEISELEVAVDPEAERRAEGPTIRPGIRINVAVEVARSLETKADSVRVNLDGEAPLPLVGEVHLAGLTLREAEAVLADAYSEYYRNPTVRIDFSGEGSDATSPWGYVTVLGQVRNPGRVNLPPTQDLTVTRAIQLAGGLDRSARDRSVRITRATENGERETLRVNLRQVGAEGTQHEDVLLRNGDVVFVPETWF